VEGQSLGLFRPNYDRPGPGVSKDEPRKKGIRRFLEILGRDLGDLVKLNLVFFLCVLPSLALFVTGTFGYFSLIAYVAAVIAAYPVGGAIVAIVFCITKRLRDDPGFIMYDFKRKFLENRKQAAAPGMIYMTLVYSQLLLWLTQMTGEASLGVFEMFAIFILFLIITMVTPYIFMQLAYVDLKTTQVVKNSVLLALAKFPRSIMGALMSALIWIAFVLYLPVSIMFLPLIALLGFSLSWLFFLMWVWPPFDKHFSVEQTINERRNSESD